MKDLDFYSEYSTIFRDPANAGFLEPYRENAMNSAVQETQQDFVLGMLDGLTFIVKVPRVSAVEALRAETVNPVSHLVIVDETEEFTWESFHGIGMSAGQLITMAETHMDGIIHRFVRGLTRELAAWSFDVRSSRAAFEPVVRVDLFIGHQNLFGPTGQIRRCDDDIRKPSLIGDAAVNEWMTKQGLAAGGP